MSGPHGCPLGRRGDSPKPPHPPSRGWLVISGQLTLGFFVSTLPKRSGHSCALCDTPCPGFRISHRRWAPARGIAKLAALPCDCSFCPRCLYLVQRTRVGCVPRKSDALSQWSLPRRLLCDEHTSRGLHGFTMTLARGAHSWFIVRMDVLNPPVKRLWLHQRWRRANGAPV